MYTKTLNNNPFEDNYAEIPMEDQLRLTAIRNPTLMTNEIVTITRTKVAVKKGASRASREAMSG